MKHLVGRLESEPLSGAVVVQFARGSIAAQGRTPHLPKPWLHTPGITAVLGSLRWFAASLLGAIATQTMATTQFAAYGDAVPAQQAGNLADDLLGFQEAVNLVSFFSAEVLLHLATWTWRFKRP